MNSKLFVISAVLILAASAAGTYFLRGPANSASGMVQETTPQDLLAHIKNEASPLVLVNFWASWCEPCKIEFPHILKVRERYAAQGLKVVFVSIDDPADLPAAERFLATQKVDFPSFYKGQQSLKFVSDIYPKWSGAIPMTLLFGPDMSIVEAWEGDTSLEEFEARVQKHLKEQGHGT